MREKIIIDNGNNDSFEADLISLFEFIDSGKKYLFFTRNEIIEDNLVKLYISEVSVNEGKLNLIGVMEENDWTLVKDAMRSILTGKENSNIKYLEVGD